MTLCGIAEAIRAKRVSATEMVRACLGRIERLDGGLRAFVQVDGERALQRAGAIDADLASGVAVGSLAGVPVAIKDNLCTVFGPTTCASKILNDYRPPYNAHVVDRLEGAGAIIVGWTNMDEFAMGSSTENSGRFASKNPWNVERVPGGSSGGSCVAVSAGMVPGALGSDTGGSVRQPAAFCGLVGLKPTYGRVSRYGLVAFASSLDQIGPIGRTAEDVALLAGAISGHDPRDSTSADQEVPDYVAALQVPLKGLRIGVAAESFGPGLNATVGHAVKAAIKHMETQGAEVADVHLPHMEYAVACYYLVANAEASSNLARYDGVHYGHRAQGVEDAIDMVAASRGEGFGAEVKRRIMLGTYALSAGYYDAYYLKALKVRALIKRDFDRAFEGVDVLISPTTPTTAFALGEKVDDPLAMYLADVYTVSANLAGICALSVPCGFDDDGLPIGMQLMGPAFSEARLLAVAHQYQLRTDFHGRRPPVQKGPKPHGG